MKEIHRAYGRFEFNKEDDTICGVVHLGKRSGGWKFLWNPNIYIISNGHLEKTNETYHYVKDADTICYIYPLTKEGIWNFINQDNIIIFDEYGEEYPNKKEWFDDCLNWTRWNNKEAWDSKSYEEWEKSQNPSYTSYPIHDNYTEMLKKEGFKFTSDSNSDFYSDGLRFAGFNEFS